MQEDVRRRAEEAIAKQPKWHHRIEVAAGSSSTDAGERPATEAASWDMSTWTVGKATSMNNQR